MKYIVVEMKGFFAPVIFPECITHSVIAGGLPIASAGFVYLDKGKVIIDDQHSESLKIAPNKKMDRNLVVSLLKNEGSYAFDKYLKLYNK